MKRRLDELLVNRKQVSTIEKARALIGAGQVYINEKIADKAGVQYPSDVAIRIKTSCPYVSRGGVKLEKGLAHFDLRVENLTCLDIGASTGGFSDCLLQNGADKVFAVDVAYGQLAWKIRQDPRVVVLERFNARNITPTDLDGEKIDLATIDASFISLCKLIPPLVPLFRKEVAILALIKPQFELPRYDIGPGGVVSDPVMQLKAIQKIENFVQKLGLCSKGTVVSPLRGPKGNMEFLIYITSSMWSDS